MTIEHPGTLVGPHVAAPRRGDDDPRRVPRRRSAPTTCSFGIAIHDEDGNHLFGTNTRSSSVDVPAADGDGEMTFEFDRVPLLDGTYLVTLAIQTTDEGTVYDWREQQYHFEVMNPSRTAGLVSLPLEVRFGHTQMQPDREAY